MHLSLAGAFFCAPPNDINNRGILEKMM